MSRAPVHSSRAAEAADAFEIHFSARFGQLLRRAYQRNAAILAQVLPDAQLTAAQFIALCAVRERPGCMPPDIAQATAIDQATVRGVVERLETRRLIAFTRNSTDGRKVTLSATKEGDALIARLRPLAAGIIEQLCAPLNAAERVAMEHMLKKTLNAPAREQVR